MLSYHFPFTYGHAHAWVVLICLMAIGAWVRHFFNLRHRGRDAWWILVTAAAALVGIAVWLRPHASAAAGPPASLAQAQTVIVARCVQCHSLHPTLVSTAPLGIVLDTAQEIDQRADLIRAFAVDSTLMPPSNATHMTSAERNILARWLAHR